MKQALKSLIIFWGIAAVLLLGFGIILLILSRSGNPVPITIHTEWDLVAPAAERTEESEGYLNYSVAGFVAYRDWRLVKNARIRYIVTANENRSWSCEETCDDGDFYLHIFIPYSELGLQSTSDVFDLNFDLEVLDYQTGWSHWKVIGTALTAGGTVALALALLLIFRFKKTEA